MRHDADVGQALRPSSSPVLGRCRRVESDSVIAEIERQTRDSAAHLGWAEHDVASMVSGFVRPVGLHFLPDGQLRFGRQSGDYRTRLGDFTAALG